LRAVFVAAAFATGCGANGGVRVAVTTADADIATRDAASAGTGPSGDTDVRAAPGSSFFTVCPLSFSPTMLVSGLLNENVSSIFSLAPL
jgi:hypothetical protein